MTSFSLNKTLKCNQGAVRVVRHNFDGKYCISGGSNTTVKLWNHAKGTLLKTYCGHGQDVLDVRSSRDNSKLCTASKDKTVFIWDVSTGKSIRRYRHHAAAVNNALFNIYDNVIIAGSVDASISMWDLRTSSMKPIQIFKDAKDNIVDMDVFDVLICSASADGWIRTYDIRKGELFSDCIGDGSIVSVALSSDMESYIVGQLDNGIFLMDLKDGKLLNEYKGHLNKEYKISCSFLNEEEFIVSGSENGHVVVWDTVSRQQVATMKHDKNIVHCVDSNGKNSILSASGDCVYFWSCE